MKILVVEDSPVHAEAAIEQLKKGNELTVVRKYDEAKALLEGQTYEVVLVDLMMPASADKLGPKGTQYVGQEMPVGIYLAIFAATKDAKYVGLLTDTNHHDHPASACLDLFVSRDDDTWMQPKKFTIGSATVCLANSGFGPYSDGKTPTKRWGAFLDYLVG